MSLSFNNKVYYLQELRYFPMQPGYFIRYSKTIIILQYHLIPCAYLNFPKCSRAMFYSQFIQTRISQGYIFHKVVFSLKFLLMSYSFLSSSSAVSKDISFFKRMSKYSYIWSYFGDSFDWLLLLLFDLFFHTLYSL